MGLEGNLIAIIDFIIIIFNFNGTSIIIGIDPYRRGIDILTKVDCIGGSLGNSKGVTIIVNIKIRTVM